jgi:hypothetical protein
MGRLPGADRAEQSVAAAEKARKSASTVLRIEFSCSRGGVDRWCAKKKFTPRVIANPHSSLFLDAAIEEFA